MTVAGGTWAIILVGGSATSEDQFWEMFTRPTGSTQWTLDTPPGVADNGGLVAAGGGSLTVAFRPSQRLAFSPLAMTSDDGKTWGTGLIDAPVAALPDALAARAGGGLLALLDDGAIDQTSAAGADWTRLAASGTVAASAAGRRCQVTALTAVAYTPSGAPLAAADCARPGVVGVFARTDGTWQATGPADSGGGPVHVLRLTSTTAGDTALLANGTGAA